MGELVAGGYNLQWRMMVLEAGLTGYGRMWEAEVREEGFVNRPEKSTFLKRRADLLTGDQTWFKGLKNKNEPPTKPVTGKHKPKIHTQEHLILRGAFIHPPYPQR